MHAYLSCFLVNKNIGVYIKKNNENKNSPSEGNKTTNMR
jgi:hypothetical protein